MKENKIHFPKPREQTSSGNAYWITDNDWGLPSEIYLVDEVDVWKQKIKTWANNIINEKTDMPENDLEVGTSNFRSGKKQVAREVLGMLET